MIISNVGLQLSFLISFKSMNSHPSNECEVIKRKQCRTTMKLSISLFLHCNIQVQGNTTSFVAVNWIQCFLMVSNTLSNNINSYSLGRCQAIKISEHNNVVGSLCYTATKLVFVWTVSVAVATVTTTSILLFNKFSKHCIYSEQSLHCVFKMNRMLPENSFVCYLILLTG